MADSPDSEAPGQAAATRLIHLGRNPSKFHGFVNTPIYRGSTVLFDSMERLLNRDQKYTYGRRGSPTIEALETVITELEGGHRTVLAPSGLGAVSSTLLALLSTGDHVLMVDSVYQPVRHFCDTQLSRLGVAVTYYDPCIGTGISGLLRHNTRVIYTENPGSQTFEMQDLPAIAEQLSGRDIWLVTDNTWASPLYCNPLNLGADVCIQAGTKYIVGHADAMLGSVTANARSTDHIVEGVQGLGMCAGSEEIYLALRGMRTLEVRIERHWQSGLEIANWLVDRPEVARVLHPALPEHPGYEIWRRDFKGASGLFSVIFHPVADHAIAAFLNNLELFGMGYSWGGFESLIVPFDPTKYRTATEWTALGPAVRIHIGLEDPADLKADLTRGLEFMHKCS